MTAIPQFDRKPYTVTYYEKGEKKTLRRRPPAKLHDLMPQDTVFIKKKKNDDFKVGQSLVIDSINPRQPNTLQVKNSSGTRTFISIFDVVGIDRPGESKDAPPPSGPQPSVLPSKSAQPRPKLGSESYLDWP